LTVRLERLEDAVHERLAGDPSPLVLAGVDYVRALYRGVSRRAVLEDGVPGAPEGLKPEALHRAALEAVRPFWERKREEAAALYRRLAGTRLASGDLKDVLPAAHLGRVAALFVALGTEVRGVFDPSDMSVREDGAGSPAQVDLLDLAAAYAFSNGGAVYAAPPERMPVLDGSPVAAVFRY
jgi:hypothetical protein